MLSIARIRPPKDKPLPGSFHIGTFRRRLFIKWSHEQAAKTGEIPKASIVIEVRTIPIIFFLLMIRSSFPMDFIIHGVFFFLMPGRLGA